MVLRMLMRLLSNNEQLIQKLSESYPLRRAARFVVFLFQRGKSITEDPAVMKKIENIDPESLKQLRNNAIQKLKSIKDYLEKEKNK